MYSCAFMCPCVRGYVCVHMCACFSVCVCAYVYVLQCALYIEDLVVRKHTAVAVYPAGPESTVSYTAF